MTDSVVLLAAQRTPIGAFQGSLAGATAPQLGAAAISGYRRTAAATWRPEDAA
jgi:acetyl-CoA C-acetyltransferase